MAAQRIQDNASGLSRNVLTLVVSCTTSVDGGQIWGQQASSSAKARNSALQSTRAPGTTRCRPGGCNPVARASRSPAQTIRLKSEPHTSLAINVRMGVVTMGLHHEISVSHGILRWVADGLLEGSAAALSGSLPPETCDPDGICPDHTD